MVSRSSRARASRPQRAAPPGDDALSRFEHHRPADMLPASRSARAPRAGVDQQNIAPSDRSISSWAQRTSSSMAAHCTSCRLAASSGSRGTRRPPTAAVSADEPLRAPVGPQAAREPDRHDRRRAGLERQLSEARKHPASAEVNVSAGRWSIVFSGRLISSTSPALRRLSISKLRGVRSPWRRVASRSWIPSFLTPPGASMNKRSTTGVRAANLVMQRDVGSQVAVVRNIAPAASEALSGRWNVHCGSTSTRVPHASPAERGSASTRWQIDLATRPALPRGHAASRRPADPGDCRMRGCRPRS